MNFNDKLQKLRKEQKLSQEELADKLDVTRQSVSKWESGQTYPEMDKLLAICKIFNCSLEELTNDEIKIEEFNKETKINIVNLILDYINKTYNYFTHISFKELIKVIFTMIIVVIVLHLLHYPFIELENIIRSTVSFLRESFLTRLIVGVSSFIIDITYSFGSIFLFFYIFKIGFLDKKEFINEEKIVEVIEDIDDDKEEIKTTKVISKKPSRTEGRFLDIIGKIIMFFIKIFLIFCAVPFVILIVLLSCALALSIGILFKGVVLIGVILGLIFSIMLISLVIEFISNIILNHKHNAKRMIISLLIALIGGGISAGILTMEISKYEFIDGSPTEATESKETFKYTYKKGMYIDSYLGGITSHLDDSLKDNEFIIEIYNYDYSSEVYLENQNNIIVIKEKTKKEVKPYEYGELIIKALKEKKIYSSYIDHNSRFVVYANSKTLNLLETNYEKAHYNSELNSYRELYNDLEKENEKLHDSIDELEQEKHNLENKNEELEAKIEEYKNKISSLMD